MRFEIAFLRSRVAIRIFVLFICCALLPVAALAILSFIHVTDQLHEQSKKRLHQTSKALGMTIIERLLLLEDEMRMVASKLGSRPSYPLDASSEEFGGQLSQRFKGLSITNHSGRKIDLLGRIQMPPELTAEERQHLRSGGTLVISKPLPDLSSRIFMGMAAGPGNPKQGILLGEIEPPYLWGAGEDNPLPPMFELCILDDSNNMLFSSLPTPVSFPEQAANQIRSSALGQFEWAHEKKEYLANYWSLFLQGMFFTPKWTVVLSESKADVLAPMTDFKKVFPLVILGSLLTVLLLGVIQIRRSLIPLEKLQEGTRRIALRDFDSRVTVKSGDEFEELAASFNTMANRLGMQFNTLTTLAEIDRAILSALDTEKIIDVVLTRMPDVFPCDYVTVALIDSTPETVARAYIKNAKGDDGKRVETINLTSEEIQELSSNPESSLLEVDGTPPNYLAPLAGYGLRSFLILPIILGQKLSGMVTLGYFEPPEYSREDLLQARQLADQMAVALSNARLIRELNQLNWGTLTALARTIDAKSSWTAGHSERVTELALKIGRALELAQEEIEALQRGGLLHDIGKIGVPPDILDKAGKLSKEEGALMREHVRLGARILEPIATYSDIISIVLQHHESFDGKGYPDGLAGEEINLAARIFAVADSFDAMTTHRPYRKAMDRKRAVEIIKQDSGSKFDPKVVKGFLEVMAEEVGEGEKADEG